MPQFLAVVIAVGILLSGVVAALPLIRQKAIQKRIHLQLVEQLRGEERISKEISDRIIAVKNDRALVERLAREKFGLARSGEIIFKFRPDPSTQGPTNILHYPPETPRDR